MNHRTWILTLDKFEVSLRGKVAVERNRFIKRVAAAYDDAKSIPANIKTEHVTRLNKILNNHYGVVMPHFAKAARKQFKKRERKALSTFESLIIEWAATEALRKARLISDTDADDITDAIAAGVVDGASIPDIAKDIRNVARLTPYRASIVARTETHNAATFAVVQSSREFAQETGAKVMKRWIPTNDPRTRDTHAEMRGSEAIPIDEQFFVGGESMDRPGDSSASAENVINCRCQVVFSEQ